MIRFRALLTLAVVFVYAGIGAARADEAPAGATGRCKDGSYTESASKKGACKGHGGVAEWLATQGTGTSEKAEKKAKHDKSSTTSAAAQTAPSTPPPDATGKCKDGSYTTSASKKGACRGHGGVAEWTGGAASSAPATPAAPAAAPATSKSTSKAETAAAAPAAKTPANTDPTGATALCKDGTYSHSKHHTGTCSHHGGVSQWLGQ